MTHAIARAHERYGIDLTSDDIRLIEMMVACGDSCRYLRKGGRNDDVWAVEYRGAQLVAVVARDTLCVKTFLPPHATWEVA